MNEREFLKEPYIGSDGKDFAKEFSEYLQEMIDNRRWTAMSDHELYLEGAKKMAEEIIEFLN